MKVVNLTLQLKDGEIEFIQNPNFNPDEYTELKEFKLSGKKIRILSNLVTKGIISEQRDNEYNRAIKLTDIGKMVLDQIK